MNGNLTPKDVHGLAFLLEADEIAELDRLAPGFAEHARGAIDQVQQIGIADRALCEACDRYPEQADRIFHSFDLLVPTNPRMTTPLVYDAHCRELAERVATGEDTQEATAVEVLYALKEVTKTAPLNTIGTALAFRLWTQAGLSHLVDVAEPSRHFDALCGSETADAEVACRRKLAQSWRRHRAIECDGYHHGEAVACRYAPAVASAPS